MKKAPLPSETVNLLSEENFKVGYKKMSDLLSISEELNIKFSGDLERIKEEIKSHIEYILNNISALSDFNNANENTKNYQIDIDIISKFLKGLDESLNDIVEGLGTIKESKILLKEVLNETIDKNKENNKKILSGTDKEKIEARDSKKINIDIIDDYKSKLEKIEKIEKLKKDLIFLKIDYLKEKRKTDKKKKKQEQVFLNKKHDNNKVIKEAHIINIEDIASKFNSLSIDYFIKFIDEGFDNFDENLKFEIVKFLNENRINDFDLIKMCHKVDSSSFDLADKLMLTAIINENIIELQEPLETEKEEIIDNKPFYGEINDDLFDPNSDNSIYIFNNQKVAEKIDEIVNEKEEGQKVVVEELEIKKDITPSYKELVKSQLKQKEEKNIVRKGVIKTKISGTEVKKQKILDEKESKLLKANFDFMFSKELTNIRETREFSENLLSKIEENYENHIFIESIVDFLKKNPGLIYTFMTLEFKKIEERNDKYFQLISYGLKDFLKEYILDEDHFTLNSKFEHYLYLEKKEIEHIKIIKAEEKPKKLNKKPTNKSNRKKLKKILTKEEIEDIKKEEIEKNKKEKIEKKKNIILQHFNQSVVNLEIKGKLNSDIVKSVKTDLNISKPTFYHLGLWKLKNYIENSDENNLDLDFTTKVIENLSESDRIELNKLLKNI